MAIESITGRVNNLPPIKAVKKADVEDQKQMASARAKHEDGVAETTLMQGFRKAVESSSASTVDLDRVNAIKQALAEGRYTIDAEKIAKKMIELEKAFPPDNGA